MTPTPPNSKAWTDAERLAALNAYDVLGSSPEAAFDDLVDLASRLCEAPVALISLIGQDRQWIKAHVGPDAPEPPASLSFCARAVELNADLVVPDTARDGRFADTPLVTGESPVRFYAGIVLRTPDGLPLGTLCVIDRRPRPQGLSDLQTRALGVLARQVMTHLELRKALGRAGLKEAETAHAVAALADSEMRFRAIVDTLPQMVWSTLPDGVFDYYNARCHEFSGTEPGQVDGSGWDRLVHPHDRQRAREQWRRSLETGEPYEIEYRLRHHSGLYRWALGRALPVRGADGAILRWFGACTDIDDLKRHEQAREALSQELNHRIKNIFAVVSALIALSVRQHPEARDFSASLRQRIQALARAHEFVRPHTASDAPGADRATLHAFLGELLSPYDDGGGSVVIEGEDAVFDDQAATPVALLFHELATNAIKYGALSAPAGRVTIRSERHGDRFILTWRETGGPVVQGSPETGGFGFTLARLAVEGQLGGALRYDWNSEGLILTADLPVTALSRRRHVASGAEPIGD